jgi:hypothetical protein
VERLPAPVNAAGSSGRGMRELRGSSDHGPGRNLVPQVESPIPTEHVRSRGRRTEGAGRGSRAPRPCGTRSRKRRGRAAVATARIRRCGASGLRLHDRPRSRVGCPAPHRMGGDGSATISSGHSPRRTRPRRPGENSGATRAWRLSSGVRADRDTSRASGEHCSSA